MSVQRKDVSKELFNDYYYVYIPFHCSQNIEEFKTRGIAGYHSKEQLANFMNSEVLVRATIPQIAKIIGAGELVRLYDINDATKMYNVIVEHLENWLYIGQKYGGRYLPPINDLLILDELADYLFNHVIFDKREAIDTMFDPLGIGEFTTGFKAKPDTIKYQPYLEEFINLGVPSK